MTEIGRELLKRRKKSGLSLREVARRANRSAAFLCDIEKGRRKPSAETLQMIEAVLESPDETKTP